jgi:hypothetical protein
MAESISPIVSVISFTIDPITFKGSQHSRGGFMSTNSQFTSRYFTNAVQVAVVGCCLAVLLASCQQREAKVENAKESVIDATQDLKEAKREARTEWQEAWVKFKGDFDKEIAGNERRIIDLRKEVNAIDMRYRDRYTVLIDKLESRNNDLRLRVNNITDEGDAKWEEFTKAMERDMDDVKLSLKNITVKNN